MVQPSQQCRQEVQRQGGLPDVLRSHYNDLEGKNLPVLPKGREDAGALHVCGRQDGQAGVPQADGVLCGMPRHEESQFPGGVYIPALSQGVVGMEYEWIRCALLRAVEVGYWGFVEVLVGGCALVDRV
jgi:hypothetical protein